MSRVGPFGSIAWIEYDGRRLVAAESKAMNWPAPEMAALLLGPLPCDFTPVEKLAICIMPRPRLCSERRKMSVTGPLRSCETPVQTSVQRLVALDSKAA